MSRSSDLTNSANRKPDSKSTKETSVWYKYKGPKTKNYSEEDFCGTLPLALLQSLFCTPILSYYLSEETQSAGQRLGARLATGIGLVVYGIIFVVVSFFFHELSVGIIIGSILALIGLSYAATALNMRRLFLQEAIWKAKKDNCAPTIIVVTDAPTEAATPSAAAAPRISVDEASPRPSVVSN